MYKSILGVVVIIGALILTTSAEAVITFERTYGETDFDEGYSVQETQDGGYIIAGVTGYYDVYFIKTDSIGDTIWTKTYGGTADDWGASVQETQDGGYIIAGTTFSFGAGWSDVYLIKTDAVGAIVWTKTYGGTEWEGGWSVQETQDGGYIIAGETGSFGNINGDVYLIKTNSLGNAVWTKAYGGTDFDGGYSVQETHGGGYIIAGGTESFGAGNRDVYLIKTDAVGTTVWTKTYGGTGDDWGRSVQETQDGGYIIAGWTESFGAGNGDVYLIKTDSLGSTIWTKTYGGTEWDEGHSVQETQDGGYIIAGETHSFGAGNKDVWLIKTNAVGDTIWTKTYGGTGDDWGRSVQETQDGGCIIAGWTESFGASGFDVYLIKTDSLGNVGIEEVSNSQLTISNYRLSVYPNPFTTKAEIRFQVPGVKEETNTYHLTPASLNIYDVSGRLVKDFSLLPSNFLLSTTVEWDGKDNSGNELQGGVYFIRLTSGNIISLRKLILVR